MTRGEIVVAVIAYCAAGWFGYSVLLPGLQAMKEQARQEAYDTQLCKNANGIVVKDIEAGVLRCIKYDFTIIENDLNGKEAK